MTMPVAVPATMMPAVPTPVPAVPVVVPVMAPAHLFGLEAVDLVRAGHGGTQFFIGGRRPLVLGQRLRRQRRGLCTRRKAGRGGRGGGGGFQKVAAFHDISLFMRG